MINWWKILNHIRIELFFLYRYEYSGTGKREEFYQYIEANGCGTTIPVLAICKLGEIDQVRQAVSRHISDLIPMPIQPDLLQARLCSCDYEEKEYIKIKRSSYEISVSSSI